MSYSKLRGRIREVFGTQELFAAAIGMNASTVSAKLNGKSDWTCEQVERACAALHISVDEMHSYFFTPKIAKSQ